MLEYNKRTTGFISLLIINFYSEVFHVEYSQKEFFHLDCGVLREYYPRYWSLHI